MESAAAGHLSSIIFSFTYAKFNTDHSEWITRVVTLMVRVDCRCRAASTLRRFFVSPYRPVPLRTGTDYRSVCRSHITSFFGASIKPAGFRLILENGDPRTTESSLAWPRSLLKSQHLALASMPSLEGVLFACWCDPHFREVSQGQKGLNGKSSSSRIWTLSVFCL